MKLSIAGEVYSGGVVKFNTSTPIDCGYGYTGDELANNTLVTQTPTYVQDLLSPGYYYTDTDSLAKMGYDRYLSYMQGNGSSTPKKTMPVLISVPDNYTLVDDTTSANFASNLFVLSYYNMLSASDKNNSSLNTMIFDTLTKGNTYTLPFLPSQLSCLRFHDKYGNLVPFNTLTIQDPTIVHSAIYKSPTTDKEYPLNFYVRSDSVICDMYIGGYHMQLVTYSNSTNDLTSNYPVYVSACNDSDFCNKFWFSIHKLRFTKINGTPTADSPFCQYGYVFGQDQNSYTVAWNTITQDRVLGKNIADNYIRYYKAFSNPNLSVGNTLALDFDPNIFNAVGVNYPANYSTIGILPNGFNFDNVGVDAYSTGYNSHLKYANDGSMLWLCLPLGTYMLDTKGSYSNAPHNENGLFKSLTVYSPNGNTIVQQTTLTNNKYVDYTTFRINNGDWSPWISGAWE